MRCHKINSAGGDVGPTCDLGSGRRASKSSSQLSVGNAAIAAGYGSVLIEKVSAANVADALTNVTPMNFRSKASKTVAW
jgi:hypothetical protein